MRRIFLLALASILSAIAVAAGCGDDGSTPDPETAAPPDTEARHGLTGEQAGETLVKIGDETITVGEFADSLAEQSPYLRARYNSPERRREFLDNMVRFELLAAEAATEGYDDHPDVVRSVKQVMIQQMMREEFEDEIQLSDITDEEIRQYFESHHDEFQKPQQVRASHILVKNQAAAQRALTAVLARPADVNFFRETAQTSNEDPVTLDRFGDLRFFSRPGEDTAPAAAGTPGAAEAVPDAVREAAFSIEQIGGVHPTLVESPAGFHIIKLTGRRAALNRTLDEARRPIQNRLWRERREARVQAFIEELRSNAEIEEHLDLLGDVRIVVPEGGSPAAEALPNTPSMPVAPPGAGR